RKREFPLRIIKESMPIFRRRDEADLATTEPPIPVPRDDGVGDVANRPGHEPEEAQPPPTRQIARNLQSRVRPDERLRASNEQDGLHVSRSESVRLEKRASGSAVHWSEGQPAVRIALQDELHGMGAEAAEAVEDEDFARITAAMNRHSGCSR